MKHKCYSHENRFIQNSKLSLQVRSLILLFFTIICATFLNTGCKFHAQDKNFNYSEQGIASWYGPGFTGRKTANGEIYNPNDMTAASRSVPLGSVVKVTSLRTGKSAVVRINDRGPYVGNRIIDLSHAAAKKIGMLGSGIAKVKIEGLYLKEKGKQMERKFQIFMIALVIFLAVGAGCAKHYGKRYSGKSVKYSASGVASWYGPGFRGRKTASGERFRPSALTAAHRTLPFGTRVRVTNLSNSKSVVVRINDRGPFTGGRIIDLSQRAAKKIGMIRSGTAKVKVVAVK